MAAPITPSRRTITPPPPAEWKPAPPPPGRKLEVVETPKAETPRAVSFGTFDSVAQDKKPGGGGMGIWIGVGAALVVILGGYFAYSHFSSKPDATPTTQTAEAKQPQPAAPASAKTASETSSGSPSATPATTTASSGAVKPATSTPQAPPLQKVATTPTPTPAQQQKPATPAPTQAPPPRQQQVVERAAVTPNASPRQDEAPKGLPAPVAPIAVPMTTSTASVASPPPKVSQSTAAQLISQVPPKYPDMARTMHATGTVIVEATIGTDGVVKGVKVLSGHPLLRDAAANSVRQWRYKPATLNGQPVETTVQVTLKFGG
jgi:protein TonB